MRLGIVLALAALVFAQPALAVITFTQLDDDLFVVSHRIKVLGLRGKAMKLVYEKTASLCVAAGYSHFEILDQESNTGQQYESANASIRARFFRTDGEERINCEKNASPEYIAQARKKLAKRGYEPPPPVAEGLVAESEAGEVQAAEADAASSTDTGDCTVEQITAMVKAGLADEQIKAACQPDPD